MDLKQLKQPFIPTDIEWRVGRSGIKDGKPWAMVLAYVTNRAIMNRLDEVCGPENWRNEFREWHGTSQICGIGIRVNGEWVTKWDGADNTDIESTKGGLSDSMKRAAVQWGIGRYLYDLEEGWAEIVDKGAHRDCIKGKNGEKDHWFQWNPPRLPQWAVPKVETSPAAEKKHEADMTTDDWIKFTQGEITKFAGDVAKIKAMVPRINGTKCKADTATKELLVKMVQEAIKAEETIARWIEHAAEAMKKGELPDNLIMLMRSTDPAKLPIAYRDRIAQGIEAAAMNLVAQESAA